MANVVVLGDATFCLLLFKIIMTILAALSEKSKLCQPIRNRGISFLTGLQSKSGL